MRFGFGLALARCALTWCAFAQSPAPPQNQAETVTKETVIKEEPATFKARVNLVMVPVVVRDKQGRAIGTLKQEDFQLFDRGKPQIISRFIVERPGMPGGKDARPKKRAETAALRRAAEARSGTSPICSTIST